MITEKVEWKQVEDWPRYEVSSKGEVRSWCVQGSNTVSAISKSPKVLSAGLSSGGYLNVVLYRHGSRQSFLVHRLVAQAFLPTDTPDLEVAHLDGNRFNNFASNLKWCTSSENNLQKGDHGTMIRGESHPRTKLCNSAVTALRTLVSAHSWRVSDVARLFDISPNVASQIVLRKVWKHIGAIETDSNEEQVS